MAKLSDLLIEIFNNVSYFNTSSGLAQLLPGIQTRKKAAEITASSNLDKAYLDFGASLAREISTNLLKKGIKPSDFSQNEEVLQELEKRLSKVSNQKMQLILSSFSEHIAKVG